MTYNANFKISKFWGESFLIILNAYVLKKHLRFLILSSVATLNSPFPPLTEQTNQWQLQLAAVHGSSGDILPFECCLKVSIQYVANLTFTDLHFAPLIKH